MKKKNLIFILIIISVFVYFFALKDKAMEVNVMKSYKGSITKSIDVTGIIDSNDVENIPLASGVNVIKTYVNTNDLVVENQLLAELDASELHISLEKANISLDDLKAKLNDITNDNSDSILLGNSLARSKEEYSKVTTDLITAKEDLSKAEVLLNENAISKAEYDKYLNSFNNLSSSLNTKELNLKDASFKYSDFQDQKSKDKMTITRQIKSLNLDIESLNNKIEDTKIYSSIKGIVTEFPIQESRKTLNGERIIIHSISSYELTAYVAQQDAVLIKDGQKSIVTIDGLNTSYGGVVSFVSKKAGSDNSGSLLPKIEIKVEITNPDSLLTFGYEGEAKIIIDSKDDILVVKEESIKKEGDKEFVYVVNNNVAKKTYVETGLSDGYLVNIINGINENDAIIINPPVDIMDGMLVKTLE